MSFSKILTLLLATRAAEASGAGTFGFATSYGHHMVLQSAPQQAVVWGTCDPASCGSVKVSILSPTTAGVSAAVQLHAKEGGAPGTWIVKLPATAAGVAPHTITATDGSATASISDVLFGDVWVCSGQSNMAFLLENAFGGADLVKEAGSNPLVRLFTSKKTNSPTPLLMQPVVEEPWTMSSAKAVSDDGCPNCNLSDTNAGSVSNNQWVAGAGMEGNMGLGDDNWLYMSAVCYIYGVAIQKHTGNPVGLVNTNWGGTPVEFWMSTDAGAMCKADKLSKDGGVPKNGGAYNGMIKPLLNMTIFGAIWYQGESNQEDPISETDPAGIPMARYGCTFPAMIRDWRAKWSEGTMGETDAEFPFGFVNLAPWINTDNGPAAIRWGQSGGYGRVPNKAMPNTFTAIAIDLTDRTSPYGSVHIRDKKTVGARLAAGGIAVAYNSSDTYWQGPTVAQAQGSTISRVAVTITFNNVGVQGLTVDTNATGFEICAMDAKNNTSCASRSVATSGVVVGEWHPAKIISWAKAIVNIAPADEALAAQSFSDMCKGKCLVRYAWAALPFEYKAAAVYARAELLPAGPFVAMVE